MLIGFIQLAWSLIPVTGGDWRFLKVLRAAQHTEEWLVYSMLCGVLLIVGAVCPMRRLRHAALFMSSIVWFTSFGMWLTYYHERGVWLISSATMLFPVLGVFCIVLLWNDVSQKPQRKEKE